MKKVILISVLLGLITAGCTKEELISSSESLPERQDGIVVLQERSPLLPKEAKTRPVVLETGISRGTNENGAMIGNSDVLLGYSYTVGNSILGDYENVISPVINLDKVKEYSEDYVTSKAILNYMADQLSYANYDSYESKLSETKKISTGFSLNLGLFKIGRKKTTESVFKSDITSNSNAVYGELNLVYRHSSFILQASEGSRRFYARACLSPVFQKNLYMSTIGSVVSTYGDYVLTGYVTGGKACALFAGITKSNSTATSREKEMDSAINASYSWGKDSSAGCDFGKGAGDSNYSYKQFQENELQTKLWVYGGTPIGLNMSSAVELENVNLNLEPWVNSLSDSKLHTMIDLTENGLYPLSAFVLEENFKRRMDYTTLGFLPVYPNFVTPYIEIVRVFERYASSGEALYDIAAVLNTRQGDKIILRSGAASSATDAELRRNENPDVFEQKAAEIEAEKQKFYDLEIHTNSLVRVNPNINTPSYFCIDLDQVDEAAMYTYTNPLTGVQYIYDNKKKIAFSHLIDGLDGDWILDDYGIRDWVESLPEKSISMASIANSYRIIGL